jgi:type IV pilus assembly protein PilM
MADQQPGVWGIDIGQCALKALRLETLDGQVTATAFDYVEHPKILSQPDADPDQLTREALEKFLSRNSLKGDQVAISVPGQSGLARFVKLPPVEEKKIPDIVRFEAKQQIPFPLDEVVWDYQKIGSGAVTDGFAMETEIGLFAIKRDMVNRALQQFRDVKVEVHLVQMAPLALCNFLSYDLLSKDVAAEPGEDGEEAPKGKGKNGDKNCVVALDIGTDNSNLVITDGERVIWQRPIPFGGNHFTRALTKDLKLTFAKAEHLKRNATKSPDLKKILTALKPVLNDFVGEVQRSLGYFTNTHRNATITYMVGLGNAFRLPGLQKFLSEKLQLEVRKLQKMERLGGESVIGAPAFTQNVLSFASAYGLALQGLKLARLQTNLLPQEIQLERMVRAKKPWAVAGAAALLLGVVAPTVYKSLCYHAYAAPTITTEIDQNVKKVVKDDGDDTRRYQAKEKDVKDAEEAVRNIIAGQDERLNWIALNQYINECLPSPGMRFDGTVKVVKGKDAVVRDHLGHEETFPLNWIVENRTHPGVDPKPEDQVLAIYNQLGDRAKKYWTADAQKAYLTVIEQQAAGKGAEAKSEDLKHLVQINIEAVYPIYCNDLKAYHEALKTNLLKLKGNDYLKRMLTEEELAKGPDEVLKTNKGWVIELRGYTYNKDHLEFLLDTLQHNLATRALLEKKDAKDAGIGAAKKPGPATATAPADKPAEKAEPATPEEKRHALWEKVLGDRVRYVVLYDYRESSDDDSTRFDLISTSVVSQLAAATAASASGDLGKPGMRAEGAGRLGAGTGTGSWAPLTGIDTGARQSGGLIGVDRPGGGPLGKSSGPRPEAPRTGAATETPDAKGAGPRRYEFIMLFIWNEPARDIGAAPSTADASSQAGRGTSSAGGGSGYGGRGPGAGGGVPLK